MGSQTSVQEDIIIKCGLEEMVKHFFENYTIVWHDPNVESEENKQYIGKLEKFCVVKRFTEWEKASLEVQQTKAYCHVITSGKNGELLVEEIHQSQKVSAIYIFCGNKDYHSQWAINYKRISCVETRMRNIIPQIQQNLMKWYKEASSLKLNLPAFAPIFDDWDKSGMNNLHLYLKVIPNFENRKQAKKDFLELSKAIYSKEKDTKLITLFEKDYQEYNKKDILNWYTQESFLYRITNKCLRIATSDSIQYCRLLLRDIEQAIKEQYREKSKNFSGLLYRGAYISEEEWLSLKANLNGEIEMHGVLSVSKDKNVALSFLRDPSKMVFITILVPKGPNDKEQGFAEVEEFSRFPKEQEILFNVRSRFTVLETEDQYSQDMPCRHLVLLYGAQGFRKFVTEKNPLQKILIPNFENASCSVCQDEIFRDKLFLPINMDKVQGYFCNKCFTSDTLQTQKDPFLVVTMTGKEKQIKQVEVKGILMKETMKVPMYGYECKKCQAKKQEIYYQCAECSSERKEVWCESCINCLSECIQKGHQIIAEGNPFSFWCEKMSKKELDHLKLQNKILEWDDIHQQGGMYVESHEFQKAIEYYKIYIEKNGGKKNDLALANCYNKMGNVYYHQAEYQKALEHHSQALEIRKLLYGNNHPDIANCYNCMGCVYSHQAEYQKALEHYSQALEIGESLYRNNHPDVASCYINMGTVYYHQAEYQKALEYHFQALEIFKSFYGNNHPDVANCYINMGNVYYDQSEYQQALEHYSQALEIGESFYGNNHPDVASCYINMGNVYYHQAEYQKALEHYSQALEIRKSLYRNNHPDVASCYINMGTVYYHQAEYQKALEYHFQALEIFKSFYGNNHSHVATCYNNIGQMYHRQAEYNKALESFFKAMEICKSLYGDNHPEMANSLTGLGKTYFFSGEPNKALEYYFKSLEMKKSFFHDHHRSLAAIYCNIGQTYNRLEEQIKALEYYLKSLEISKQFFHHNNHPDIAESFTGLGRVHFSLGEHEKALEYHFKSLEIRKSVFHEDHPDVAECHHDIANVWKSQGKQKEALESYSKAWEIRKQVFRENHPDTIAVDKEIKVLSKVLEKKEDSKLSFSEDTSKKRNDI